jgi:nucleotide-binding universal stress UspA family protein
MAKPILVPLDGSRFSESALPAALEVRAATGGVLGLVQAVALEPELSRHPRARRAERYLRKVAGDLEGRGAGPVTIAAPAGPPVDVIHETAASLAAGLIVMSTHGRRGLRRLRLGSVAEAVIRSAGVPILAVRRDPDGDEATPPPPAAPRLLDHILVPTDGTAAAEDVLAVLARLARAPEAKSPRVTLLRVLENADEQAMEGDVRAALARAVEADRRFGLAVEARVVEGDPVKQILAVAKEAGASLIAMATHGRSGAWRVLLGSVAEEVLRQAPVPVLILREPAPAPG